MNFSIITVCFNAVETIEETFLSILNQTNKDFELIVIDGGSTDGTIEIIEKYKDEISCFISEPDNGVYDAMNKGIKAAKGEFLFFLNANDTFYDENILEKASKALDENPEVKFLFGDVEYIAEDKKSSQIIKFDKITNDFAILHNNICHQSIFYHKSLFEDFGLYCDEYKIYADWDFNVKCLVQNKVKAFYLPEIISKFQLGGVCSNSAHAELCNLEKKLLIKKYSKDSFFIFLYYFLKKNFRNLSESNLHDIFAKFFSKIYKFNL